MSKYLEKFNIARQAVEIASNVDELALIADQAEAYRYAVRQAKQGIEMENQATELKLRAERKAGQLIKDGQEKGEIRKQGRHGSNSTKVLELGISHTQSSTFKKVADLPEVEFERQIKSIQEEKVQLTRNRLIKEVNEAMDLKAPIIKPKPKTYTVREIGHEDPVINMMVNLHRYSATVSYKEFREYLNNLINAKIKDYDKRKKST